MVSTVYWEWGLLIKSIRLGLCLGILFDVISIFRMLIVHSPMISALEDALYWLIATPAIFCLLQTESQGVFRGFSVMGILLSLFLYHNFLAKLWLPWIEKIIVMGKRRLTKGKKILRIIGGKLGKKLKFHRRSNGKEKNSCS